MYNKYIYSFLLDNIMALVNRKVSVKVKSKKLSRAINNSRYDTKYHENNEKLLKSISIRRDLDKNIFF